MSKTYNELRALPTFRERFDYLSLHGEVAAVTFGSERYLHQKFFKSAEWRRVRDKVVIRDSVNGVPCDLGCPDHPIADGDVVIHHMNPSTRDELRHKDYSMLDPENLITTCTNTHRALHYGTFDMIPKDYVARTKNDTCPWKG